MAIDQYNHFVALVAGDNPEVLMSPYDKNMRTEPRVMYRYADAAKLRDHYLKVYRAITSSDTVPEGPFKEDARDKLAVIESQAPEEFYLDLTEDYERDKETGDALTTENPDGKWSSYRLGKLFSIPFVLNDGTEPFSLEDLGREFIVIGVCKEHTILSIDTCDDVYGLLRVVMRNTDLSLIG